MRATGIEPVIRAWEAHVLPLYYARGNCVDVDVLWYEFSVMANALVRCSKQGVKP